MYQALYRKYRPQIFDDVIGQQHITDSLKKQVETGHLSHAYIFIGTRGTGKTTCARILAKAVNCEHPVNGNPCCQCDACRGIADGSVMDIVELDAASNNGVDNVRALREEAFFSPANVKKRVYIIDEVHMLSASAFNALLKILEEPPEHLIFVLATTELQKVPATILSRCQRHSFKRIDNDVLSSFLLNIASKEGLTLSNDAASLISGLAEGSARDALSMLEQCSTYDTIDVEQVYSSVGLAGNKRIMSLFNSIMDNNTESALEELNLLWKDGKDISGVFKELSGLCRDVLIYCMAPKNADKLIYGGYELKDIKMLSEKYSSEVLLHTLDELQTAGLSMKDRLDSKVVAELCIARLCSESFVKIDSTSVEISNNKVKTAEPVIAPQRSPATFSETKTAEPSIPDITAKVNSIPEEPAAPEIDAGKGDAKTWDIIKEELKPLIPFDMKAGLSNVIGEVNDIFLDLKINSDFLYGRFNKPEIITLIENVAQKSAGKRLKVRLFLSEAGEKTEARSFDDLKGFNEINWR